eukprot:COSAG01_NODE_63498_length_279_cov_6.027778_1_plen_30_part_10
MSRGATRAVLALGVCVSVCVRVSGELRREP